MTIEGSNETFSQSYATFKNRSVTIEGSNVTFSKSPETFILNRITLSGSNVTFSKTFKTFKKSSVTLAGSNVTIGKCSVTFAGSNETADNWFQTASEYSQTLPEKTQTLPEKTLTLPLDYETVAEKSRAGKLMSNNPQEIINTLFFKQNKAFRISAAEHRSGDFFVWLNVKVTESFLPLSENTETLSENTETLPENTETLPENTESLSRRDLNLPWSGIKLRFFIQQTWLKTMKIQRITILITFNITLHKRLWTVFIFVSAGSFA